jgi:hypothetical protein
MKEFKQRELHSVFSGSKPINPLHSYLCKPWAKQPSLAYMSLGQLLSKDNTFYIYQSNPALCVLELEGAH